MLDVHDVVALVSLRKDHLVARETDDPLREPGGIEKRLCIERDLGTNHRVTLSQQRGRRRSQQNTAAGWLGRELSLLDEQAQSHGQRLRRADVSRVGGAGEDGSSLPPQTEHLRARRSLHPRPLHSGGRGQSVSALEDRPRGRRGHARPRRFLRGGMPRGTAVSDWKRDRDYAKTDPENPEAADGGPAPRAADAVRSLHRAYAVA